MKSKPDPLLTLPAVEKGQVASRDLGTLMSMNRFNCMAGWSRSPRAELWHEAGGVRAVRSHLIGGGLAYRAGVRRIVRR
jgi:hypothetical protein